MATEEEITAARAEIDQAQAAVSELEPQHRELTEASVAAHADREQALVEVNQRITAARDALGPVDTEMEKRRGAVRAAEDKLRTLEAGGTPSEPPAQGVGG